MAGNKLLYDIQSRFSWLLENKFYLARVVNGGSYTVSYFSLDGKTRINFHLEQREPLMVYIAQLINEKWQGKSLGEYLELNQKNTLDTFEPLYDFLDEEKYLKFMERTEYFLRKYIKDIVNGK